MSDNTKIEWSDATWNPVTGCTKVSPGCDHCYASTFAERWRGTPGHYFENGFDVVLRPDKLDLPFKWRKPRKVFVNSMSDLFHDSVPDAYIMRVLAVMALNPRHTFQVLTKRHGRMRSLLNSITPRRMLVEVHREKWAHDVDASRFEWPLRNVWLGVSVENQQWADIRIPTLLDTRAAVRWISAEPLLGPVDLSRWLHLRPIGANLALNPLPRATAKRLGLTTLDWVVVGGESGRGARPMHPDWARALRDQCVSAEVPFLYKQHGEWAPQQVGSYSELMTFAGRGRGCVVEPDGRISAAWSMGGGDARADGVSPAGASMLLVGKHSAGRELDGRTWDEYPAGAS